MAIKGHWIGYYEYHNKAYGKLIGNKVTNFEIEIKTVDNNNFTGNVQDDLSTGGTQGVGEITGKIIGNNLKFVKQMPVMSLLVDKKGTRKTFNKKHRKIYYSGVFSNDGKSISGRWRFKFGLIWFGLIPILVKPTKGTWTMKLKE